MVKWLTTKCELQTFCSICGWGSPNLHPVWDIMMEILMLWSAVHKDSPFSNAAGSQTIAAGSQKHNVMQTTIPDTAHLYEETMSSIWHRHKNFRRQPTHYYVWTPADKNQDESLNWANKNIAWWAASHVAVWSIVQISNPSNFFVAASYPSSACASPLWNPHT